MGSTLAEQVRVPDWVADVRDGQRQDVRRRLRPHRPPPLRRGTPNGEPDNPDRSNSCGCFFPVLMRCMAFRLARSSTTGSRSSPSLAYPGSQFSSGSGSTPPSQRTRWSGRSRPRRPPDWRRPLLKFCSGSSSFFLLSSVHFPFLVAPATLCLSAIPFVVCLCSCNPQQVPVSTKLHHTEQPIEISSQ